MIQPPIVPATHGDLVRSLKTLDAHLAGTVVSMRALIERYAATFQQPPCQLVFHTSAGVLSLRWRSKGPAQRYFELCGNQVGERTLQQQSGDAAELLLRFDGERIDLNFTYQTTFYLRKRLRGLREKRVASKAMRIAYGTRAKQSA